MNVMKSKKGALTAESVIGLLIVVIIIVAAAIPVVVSITTNLSTAPVNGTAQLSGTTLIIVGLIPLFLALAALIATAKSMKG